MRLLLVLISRASDFQAEKRLVTTPKIKPKAQSPRDFSNYVTDLRSSTRNEPLIKYQNLGLASKMPWSGSAALQDVAGGFRGKSNNLLLRLGASCANDPSQASSL